MTTLVKTVRASELPTDWQTELGVPADDIVTVSITGDAPPKRSDEEKQRLLAILHAIRPVKIDEDSTTFIRRERDRIDGRGS